MLDLRVPVGALDEPDRDPAVHVAGQSLEVDEDVARPALIGLHRQPETVVIRQACIAQYAFEYLK